VRFHLVAQGILRPQNIFPALIVNITTFLWDSGLSEAKPRKGEALQWRPAQRAKVAAGKLFWGSFVFSQRPRALSEFDFTSVK